jgi:hypothetical protein
MLPTYTCRFFYQFSLIRHPALEAHWLPAVHRGSTVITRRTRAETMLIVGIGPLVAYLNRNDPDHIRWDASVSRAIGAAGKTISALTAADALTSTLFKARGQWPNRSITRPGPANHDARPNSLMSGPALPRAGSRCRCAR